MDALAGGRSVTVVARCFQVSRQTVWRYQGAAALQHRPVPQPRPMGGYRRSKLARAEVVALSQWALEQPKRTLSDLRTWLEASGAPRVSSATVSRALHKTGLRKRRAHFVDSRVHTRPLIAAERVAFCLAQRTDPLFRASRLLFFDETLFYLNAQARSGWAPKGTTPIWLSPKGRTASAGLLLTAPPFCTTSSNRPLAHSWRWPLSLGHGSWNSPVRAWT